MKNLDESKIVEIANSVPGVSARFATLEEDCGFQKADVVLTYITGTVRYLQVSHAPKSGKEEEKLRRRGTLPISTHKYFNMPYSVDELGNKIASCF